MGQRLGGVVLVSSSAEPVGVATHVLNLAKLLDGAGLLDTVVCPTKGNLSEKLGAGGLPYAVVGISHQPSAFIRSSLLLSRFLRSRVRAKVVHLHGRFPLLVAVPSLLANRGKRFVATVHQFGDVGSNGALGWKESAELFVLHRMKRICCVSNDLRSELLSRLGGDWSRRVDAIPNWIEPVWNGNPSGCPTVPVTGRPAKICAVGSLIFEKGFDTLVESMGILKREGYSVECDIFGKGPELTALSALANRLGVTADVRFVPPTPDVRRLLPNYDAVVVPSRSESFGLVALEAYDAFVPVIASGICGLRETTAEGRAAMLFEAGNAASLASAVREVTTSSELSCRLRNDASLHLRGYLPRPELRDAYLNFYSNALA